jgi:hypothetical protein
MLREFMEHYHAERNHQGLGNVIPFPSPDSASPVGRIGRRERLGGVVSFYMRNAARIRRHRELGHYALRIKSVLGSEDTHGLARALQRCEGVTGVLLRPPKAAERRSRDLGRHERRISSTLRVPRPQPLLYTPLVNGLLRE